MSPTVVIFENPNSYQGVHEEADTLIAFHSSQIVGNIMVRSSDTDVLVILIGMMGKHISAGESKTYEKIILDCGSGNTRRLVDVNTICVNLEEVCNGLTRAVPSFHAFTGTDYTCPFYGKEKTNHGSCY